MSETEAGRRLPELEVVARGMIFSAEDASAEEAVAYFTSLVPLASGTWLSGWQLGPGKQTPNTIGLARSCDQGESWQRLSHSFETSWQGTPGSFLAAEMGEIVLCLQ